MRVDDRVGTTRHGRDGAGPGWKRVLSRVLVVLAGVLLPLGVVAGWANATLYDSDTFSQRAVDLLGSPAVRRELAVRLTEQLAEGGNREAVNFRPAFQLAIEGAVDTDAFRSIFRIAIARTHHALLDGRAKGVDLSDSVSIIANTLQLPNDAKPGQQDKRSVGTSFTDVTRQMADLHIWQIQDWSYSLWLAGFFGGLAAAAGAVALSADRRRTVQHLGWALVAGGLVIAGLVLGIRWFAARSISDPTLAAAVRDAVGRALGDLRSIGLWMAGYGVVVAAAAAAIEGRRITPARITSAVGGWVERRRASSGGRVALGATAVLGGLVLIRYESFWPMVAVLLAGLWLAYFGVSEVLLLVRQPVAVAAPDGAGGRAPRRRALRTAVTMVVVLALVTVGLVLTTRSATRRAQAAGAPRCNGETALCDLPLNLAVFPGTHNSMSSANYPGFLFAEHVRTIGQQLDAGVRALLLDTHYGVPSSARLPGSETQVVITDRAAELVNPTGEGADPVIAERAARLAARAPVDSKATRGIYLCHNFCEMGSVRFSDALGEIKSFVDTHPDDVVILDIQDATTPADTAAAITKAGLAERAFTLDPDRPLPTLGDMIKAGQNLLVFAEGGGPGAPPWYHKAYEHWVQETQYAFTKPGDMTCGPNRGPDNAPLFLLNHWLEAAPPDPSKANLVNSRAFLEARIRRCSAERGLVPNIVAVDFSARGDLVPLVSGLNRGLLGQVSATGRRPPSTRPSTGGPTTTSPPGPSIAPLPSISAPTRVNTLTGGDPETFCAGASAVRTLVGSWALADITAPPSQQGMADLTLGPAAARAIDRIAGVAPTELAQLLGPTRERAQAAVQALSDAGITAETLDDVATGVERDLTSNAETDANPTSSEESLAAQSLADKLGPGRLAATAQAFAASHPHVPGTFDLGDVSEGAARASGYDCLVPVG